MPSGQPDGSMYAGDMLDVRMLFSALVDADFLETEAHFQGDATKYRQHRRVGPTLDIERAIEALTEHLARIRDDHSGEPMAETRDVLYRRCIETAAESTGPFSLAGPTGSGKTLAMLAFALHHARVHGLRRIVLVMPFLNIIEQTARVYRSIFSCERGFHEYTVLEHHSLAENGDGSTNQRGDGVFDDSARLFTQNWDAPIVLTTSVQFFESLMADRSSRCRKLHRLARSVILFDEVQTLPIKLAVATLATVSRLVDPDGPYASSVVFATATQPAFDTLDDRVRDLTSSGWRPREIMANPERLYTEAAKRVRVSWRYRDAIDLEALAVEVAQHDRVLCIVNLKRHAIRLAAMLREDDAEGLCHLSTNMCPAHRVAVLTDVKERLKRFLPVKPKGKSSGSANVAERIGAESRAAKALAAIASGDRLDLRDSRYFALTLSANSGRVVIRDWMEGQFEELAAAIEQWRKDLSIVHRHGHSVVEAHKFLAVLAAPLRDLKDAHPLRPLRRQGLHQRPPGPADRLR